MKLYPSYYAEVEGGPLHIWRGICPITIECLDVVKGVDQVIKWGRIVHALYFIDNTDRVTRWDAINGFTPTFCFDAMTGKDLDAIYKNEERSNGHQ